MKSNTIFTLSLLFSLFTLEANAQNIPIVSKDNCSLIGTRLMRCSYALKKLTLDSDSFVPSKTKISIERNGNCQTQYPITIKATTTNGYSTSFSGLHIATHSVPQEGSVGLTLEVIAPYKNIAYFNSNCKITASVIVDAVDIDELKDTLSELKEDTEAEISILNDRINDKSTIATLLQATFAMEQLVKIAEQDTTNFYNLNQVLLNSCSPDLPCSWTDQIFVILDDPNIYLPFAQQMMLFQLAEQLDALLPANCEENNCISQLIDEKLSNVISALRSNIDLDGLEEQIAALVSERFDLEDILFQYKEIADKHNIDWNSL